MYIVLSFSRYTQIISILNLYKHKEIFLSRANSNHVLFVSPGIILLTFWILGVITKFSYYISVES